MIEFETHVHIDEPPERVFGYLADPKTYPRWNSAVERVQPLDGSRKFELYRRLPDGGARNVLEITEVAPPTDIVIEASDGPTPFVYHYRLRSSQGGTELQLKAAVDTTGLPRLFARAPRAVAARAIKSGVNENLRALKRLVEK